MTSTMMRDAVISFPMLGDLHMNPPASFPLFGREIYWYGVLLALAFLAVRLGWIPSVDKIIIGNIMLLIPGIALTNSLRDMISGDIISGLLRFLDAILVAAAVCVIRKKD